MLSSSLSLIYKILFILFIVAGAWMHTTEIDVGSFKQNGMSWKDIGVWFLLNLWWEQAQLPLKISQ